jgi:ankyrin repeat protein
MKGGRKLRGLLSLMLLLTAAAAAAGQSAETTPKFGEKEVAAFFESVERNDAAAVRRALAGGMSPGVVAPLSGGEAALMRAVRLGHAEVAEALLDAGADINVKEDGDESSALSVAVAVGAPRVVRLLLARGADVNYGDKLGHSNLMTAATAAGESSLTLDARLFLNMDAESVEGLSHGSVSRGGRVEIVRLLLQAGADVNLRADDCGLSALLSAALLGDAEVARLLLDAGADPNLGSEQFTPLSVAEMKFEELMQKAEGDAAPDAESQRRALVFFEATAPGRAEIARLLRAASYSRR